MLQLAQKEKRLGGQSDPMGIEQKILIWPYEQIVYAQPRICPGEWDAQILQEFWDTKDLLISARRPDLIIIKNKKEELVE